MRWPAHLAHLGDAPRPHADRAVSGRARCLRQGVIRPLATTALEMAVHEPLSRDEQDRLAALWEQPSDDDRAVDTPDDVIAALFAAAGIDEPPTAPRPRTGATRRPDARRRYVGGDRGRSRPRRAEPRAAARWVAVGVVLLVGLVLTAVALDGMTGSTDTRAPDSSTAARRAAAPDRPAPPTPATPEPRRARAVGLRAQRAHRRRARAARSGRARSRRAQRSRTAATRARRPARPVQPRSEPPATPSTVRPRNAPIPTSPSSSSACDEFPPC